MSVISVAIIESPEQDWPNVPRAIKITTSVSATIFYTLDGSTPTSDSDIYIDEHPLDDNYFPLVLPTDKVGVTISILAISGNDSSPIIVETYFANIASGTNARLPHASTQAVPSQTTENLYPFGSNPIQPNAPYINPADSSITVDNPALSEIPAGYDGSGQPDGYSSYTNQPYDSTNYSIKYSTTDAIGQSGHGIGNLPATVTVEPDVPPPSESNINSNTFDPRALVIFQDVSQEDPDSPPHINKMNFSLENPERARDGNNFYTSGLDAPPVNGTFIRSHYNPRTNCITYYYLDTWSNRWIISTTPYVPTGTWDNNMSGMMSGGSHPGSRHVYEWIPFQRRVLF